MLKQNLGMTVDHEIGEPKETYLRMYQNKIGLMWIRWYMDYPDPIDVLQFDDRRRRRKHLLFQLAEVQTGVRAGAPTDAARPLPRAREARCEARARAGVVFSKRVGCRRFSWFNGQRLGVDIAARSA
jgi:hypothetical protein